MPSIQSKPYKFSHPLCHPDLLAELQGMKKEFPDKYDFVISDKLPTKEALPKDKIVWWISYHSFFVRMCWLDKNGAIKIVPFEVMTNTTTEKTTLILPGKYTEDSVLNNDILDYISKNPLTADRPNSIKTPLKTLLISSNIDVISTILDKSNIPLIGYDLLTPLDWNKVPYLSILDEKKTITSVVFSVPSDLSENQIRVHFIKESYEFMVTLDAISFFSASQIV